MKARLVTLLAIAFAVLVFTGCRKIKERIFGAPSTPTATSGGSCDVHPGWCRGRCKSWNERSLERHADRIGGSTGFALGTCDGYDVFAESDATGGTITEYYDKGALVAATDTRATAPCPAYGAVPTCKPSLEWSDAGVGERWKLNDGTH